MVGCMEEGCDVRTSFMDFGHRTNISSHYRIWRYDGETHLLEPSILFIFSSTLRAS